MPKTVLRGLFEAAKQLLDARALSEVVLRGLAHPGNRGVKVRCGTGMRDGAQHIIAEKTRGALLGRVVELLLHEASLWHVARRRVRL